MFGPYKSRFACCRTRRLTQQGGALGSQAPTAFYRLVRAVLEATGTITYDVPGIKDMCNQLREQFQDDTANEMNQMLKGKYTSELEEWLIQAI